LATTFQDVTKLDEEAVAILFDNAADLLNDKFIMKIKCEYRALKIIKILSKSIVSASTFTQLYKLQTACAEKFANWPDKVKTDGLKARINFMKISENAHAICKLPDELRNVTICDIDDNLATWDEDRRVAVKLARGQNPEELQMIQDEVDSIIEKRTLAPEYKLVMDKLDELYSDNPNLYKEFDRRPLQCVFSA